MKKTSNIVLLSLGIFVVGFVIAMTVTYWVKGGVPDTLIQYTLGAGGIEAVLLAGIKITITLSGKAAESEDTDGEYNP